MSKNNYAFVLDCSVAMAWCFEDESSDFADAVLENLQNLTAVVPTIWPLEVANVLLMAKKKGRITEVQAANFIGAVSVLPIIIDQSTSAKAMHSILLLADKADITIYDAAYLELAMREKIPLITLDKKLMNAAKKMHISLKIN